MAAAEQQLALLDKVDDKMQQGLLEAAVAHLYQAYRCYLAEVSTAYHVELSSLPAYWSMLELEKLLASQGLHSGELTELESQPWIKTLEELHRYSQRLSQKADVKPSASVIALQSSTVKAISASTVNSVLQDMRQVIARQRTDAQEC